MPLRSLFHEKIRQHMKQRVIEECHVDFDEFWMALFDTEGGSQDIHCFITQTPQQLALVESQVHH